MATENNNTQINSFNKGINTDGSYANILQGYYLYAENLRNYALNKQNNGNNNNQYSTILAIEGCKWNDTYKLYDFEHNLFKITNILAADTIRDIGIIIAEGFIDNSQNKKQWCVIRVLLTNEFELTDPKIIYMSGTDDKEQLRGDKVSIVLKFETDENIKLYIADGYHFIMILNIASSNDEYNEKISGDVSKIEAQQTLFLHPIKFLGLTSGSLTAGVVQYAYRLYDQNGSASPMSCITNTILIVLNKENSDSNIVKGGAKGDYLGCGVKLRITIDSDNKSVYNHIEIYRIFYEESGQLPKVGVIYNKKIPNITNTLESVQNIDYTDFGQDYLSETTVDEFNNISGVHIIPKVLESKNGRLFAANIKDSKSNLVDIANHFDARTFRFNFEGKCKYSQYTDQEHYTEITRDDVDNFNDYDGSTDTNDYFNQYNDITKPTVLNKHGVSDDYKFGELSEDGYPLYGGYGKNIKWRFVLTELVGDYTNTGTPSGKRETSKDSFYLNVGAVGNTLLTQYEGCNDSTEPMLYNNKLRYAYIAYDKQNNTNLVLKLDDIDYTELFESSTDQSLSYSNACVSYGFRSLRRDELYRFGIILYNKRNEATPVMWIGDIRTPSCNENGFDTYESNSSNSALVVRPLGILFSVDLTSINKYIEDQDKYTDLDKIQAYEIVRCYRSSNDVQNIAQGVLSRPIKKVKNPNSSVTIDPVYTPTGILTTAAYWNGECWVAHNEAFVDKYGLDSDEVKKLNEYEADNFDNNTLFQFICPEACYNKEYINTITQKQNLYLLPIYYIFGMGKGGKHYDDTCFEHCYNKNIMNGSAFSSFYAIEPYYYTSTAWSNNQQPLPPYITTNNIIECNKESLLSFYKFGLTETNIMPVDLFIAKKQVGGFIKTPLKLILYSKTYTEDEKGNKTYQFLNQNLLFFIYDSYGRSMINYFENKANTRNGYDMMVTGNIYENDNINKNLGFRFSTSGNDYLTYKTPEKHKQGAASCTSLGIVAQPQYKNYMNCIQYVYGYSKLYEKSNNVILRGETSPLNIDPYSSTLYTIGNNTKYKISDVAVALTLNWDDVFSGDTKDGKTTYSYRYNDYVQPVGIYSYCNVIAGGKYGESIYLSTDKVDGLFNSDGATKISYGDMPSGLLGTAGSSVLINIEAEDNILSRSLATNNILKCENQNTSLSKTINWDAEQYRYMNSNNYTLGENFPDEKIKEHTKDVFCIYDQLYYYNDVSKEVWRYIYRPSITGTYLCNLRLNTVPYDGYLYTSRISNTYVSCGNYYKNNENGNVKIIFNGDCYIQPFEYVSAHKYYYKDVKSPVTTCLVYTFPVETNINMITSYGSEFSKIIDDKGLCTNILQQPANVNDIYSQDKPEYVYNSAYSQQSNAQTHQTIDMSSDSNTLKKVDYRCYYSELKSNNENIDSWQVFKPANFLDVDDKYGEITHLRTFNNKLIFWQEHAVGEFSVNERSQISDDSGKPLVLGVGNVLDRYDYYDRTTGMHKEQYCDSCSNSVLYWFDSHNDEIKALSSNGIVQLNKIHGTQNIMHERKGVQYPKMFYDKKYNELVSKVLHTSVDQSLAYNEMIQEFTSVYDISFDESLTFDDNIYLLNSIDNGIKIGHWNYGDGVKNTILRYVVNESPMITKVFDNQEIVTEQQFVPRKQMFNECRFSWATELFDLKVITDPVITNREGNFRYSLPRVGNAEYGNRLRGKYMISEIYNISTIPISYIITKFRRSCS